MVGTEMGRKSDKQTGCVTVGTGVTIAVNHDLCSRMRILRIFLKKHDLLRFLKKT